LKEADIAAITERGTVNIASNATQQLHSLDRQLPTLFIIRFSLRNLRLTLLECDFG